MKYIGTASLPGSPPQGIQRPSGAACRRHRHATLAIQRQRGTALLIVLVALSLLFALAAAGLQRAMLQLRMVDNQWQYHHALVAAQSAAASASAWLASQTQRPIAGAGNTQYPRHRAALAALTPGLPWWQYVDDMWWRDNAHTLTLLQDAAEPPRYVIEEFLVRFLAPPAPDATPPTVVVYRITARGNGATVHSKALVQSYYTKVYE